ncbi:MAG: HAMP domain-containing sensor histidine kinase [Candidatus Wildermuthbacteria bacterium]|nr:HAMP domain-containing sensor histidine kinase [Candidatus Wildermuthbacteria bacterium]
MGFQSIVAQLDLPNQCKKYGLPLWQCPQFLFLVMGVIIIISSLSAYAIGTRFIDDPLIVAMVVIALTIVLLIVASAIVQSFDRLAAANKMKSEFVSVVSHQLRSPLSNLKWAIEFLMSGKLGKVEEKQAEYLQILKENSARMQELVSDLLTVSRIETAKLPVIKQEFSLEDLARDLVSRAEPFAKASNVEIRFQFEAGLPKVFSDPRQIQQAIENLLDNAVRYVRNNGVVELKLSQRNGSLRVEIKDNGVGIPAADQKYIFQKFFRSENALRYQTQGSGLGLYISKAIIEKAGGEIGFSSQEGKGSTFWITLPIK